MNADRADLHPVDGAPSRELTGQILRAFFEVNWELGHGFLEVVYLRALRRAMADLGLRVETEVGIPVRFRGDVIGCFRADMLVERLVLVEVKALPQLEPAHTAQLLNYLRASDVEVGLLLNCGRRPSFKRLAFGNERKQDLRSSAYVRGARWTHAAGAAALDASRPHAPR